MRKLGAHFKEEMTVGIPLLITKCALKKASESERQCFLKKTIYYLFIHLFLALLGLSRWAHAISSCSKQGATLVVGHRLLVVVASRVCVCVCVCVCVWAQSLRLIRLFATLWTIAHQAPLFMEFPWQEYWSG